VIRLKRTNEEEIKMTTKKKWEYSMDILIMIDEELKG
jgi:hypothetical protein